MRGIRALRLQLWTSATHTQNISPTAHESYTKPDQANQLNTCTFFISYIYSYNTYKLFLGKPNIVKKSCAYIQENLYNVDHLAK